MLPPQASHGAGKKDPLAVSLGFNQHCPLQDLHLFHPLGCPQRTLSPATLLMWRSAAKLAYEVMSLHSFSQGFFKILIL